MSSKKGGKKKGPPDQVETSKLLAAKISQLETDVTSEKDQQAEIGRFTRRVRNIHGYGWKLVSEGSLVSSQDADTKQWPTEFQSLLGTRAWECFRQYGG
jgi:hypothetical protein